MPLFSLIQMLKFVLSILNLKWVKMSEWSGYVIDLEDML